jgi:hypothetical protein
VLLRRGNGGPQGRRQRKDNPKTHPHRAQ